LLTQREEDKRVRRGKAARKGATVIFWRFAVGAEEEVLLALRVLLLENDAMFCGLVDWMIEITGLALGASNPRYEIVTFPPQNGATTVC